MSNDKTTLADVQPGGRVRLGDQALSTSEGARRYVADFFATQLRRQDFGDYILTELAADFACALAQHLSAQPSPGGQGDALAEAILRMADHYAKQAEVSRRTVNEAAWLSQIAHELRIIAARQPVGEPVDDYDSAFQDVDRPPYLVDAAGIYALKSFLTVAEEFRRSAEPYIEAINEGACGGEDEVSEAFDTQLARAKEAISRSVIYAAPPAQALSQDWQHIANEWADAATNGVQWLRNISDGASTVADALACMESNVERIHQLKPPAQAVDLGQFRAVVNYWIEDCKTKPLGDERAGFIAYGERLLALIDSQAVGK